MTVMGKWSLPVILLTQEPLIVFSLPCRIQPRSTHHTIYGRICNLLFTINPPVTSNYKNVVLFCTITQSKFWWYSESHNRRVQYKTTACKAIKIHWFTIGLCLKVAQVFYKMVQTRLLPLSGLFAWVFLSFYVTGSTESFFKEKFEKSYQCPLKELLLRLHIFF